MNAAESLARYRTWAAHLKHCKRCQHDDRLCDAGFDLWAKWFGYDPATGITEDLFALGPTGRLGQAVRLSVRQEGAVQVSKHHRLPSSTCPDCGYVMDAATAVSRKDATPKPGDASLCLKCGALLRFADDLTLIRGDFDGLSAEQVMLVLKGRRAILKLKW